MSLDLTRTEPVQYLQYVLIILSLKYYLWQHNIFIAR